MVIRIETAASDSGSEVGVVDCNDGVETGLFIVDEKNSLVLIFRDKIQ